jgi:hypothetical protein
LIKIVIAGSIGIVAGAIDVVSIIKQKNAWIIGKMQIVLLR